MTKKEIMKRAHEIARTILKGDYRARMSLALRLAWAEAEYKSSVVEIDSQHVQFRVQDMRVTCRMNRWTRGNHDRLYFNQERSNGRYSRFCHVDLKTGRFVWDIPETNPILQGYIRYAASEIAIKITKERDNAA